MTAPSERVIYPFDRRVLYDLETVVLHARWVRCRVVYGGGRIPPPARWR